jgi:hypothetical protein
MVIDPRLTILKPPAAPRDPGTAAGWGDVGRRLGEVLPGDYMKFIELYGSGMIAEFLTVLNRSRPITTRACSEPALSFWPRCGR